MWNLFNVAQDGPQIRCVSSVVHLMLSFVDRHASAPSWCGMAGLAKPCDIPTVFSSLLDGAPDDPQKRFQTVSNTFRQWFVTDCATRLHTVL